MKNVLVITPKSIAGELIMKSLALGFEVNKCKVLTKQVDIITEDDVEKFKPDMIIGYDYSFLMEENCKKIIQKSNCKNLVFYFADEPKGKFALGDRNYLYDELKNINPTVFIWDKDFLNDFENSFYLPLAVDPSKYLTEFSGYKYDITFVGRPLSEYRQKILCDLIKVFKNKLAIFSYEKHFLQSIEDIKSKNLLDEADLEIYSKSWKGFIKTEKELAKIYNSSKINLNITIQGKSSINYRVYEVLASGGFLLTDEKEDLKKYFKISKHLETYKDTTDLIDKINFYLNNLNIAQKIAQLGRFECIESNNFSARAKSIMAKVF